MDKFKRIDSQKEWQDFLSQTKFMTFFHNLEWENFVEQEFKQIKFERYLYDNSLLLSLAHVGLGGHDKFISHPFCEYGGPLPLVDNINFGNFVADIKDKFGLNVRINFHPAVLSAFVNLPSNSDYVCKLNSYWVDWRSVEGTDFLKNIRKTLRHSIEHLLQENYEICECQDEDDLAIFYRLYLKNMRRKMNLALPFSFFKYFFKDKNAEIILAKKNHKIFAGSIFLHYGNFIHYFLNAGLEENNPSPLILFEQAKKVSSQKKILDLGGTRFGSSLEIFKQGWHGEKKSIVQIGATDSSMRHSMLRRLWRILPLSAVDRLSKKLFARII